MERFEKVSWRKRLLDPATEAEEHSKAQQETATLVREIALATQGLFDEKPALPPTGINNSIGEQGCTQKGQPKS